MGLDKVYSTDPASGALSSVKEMGGDNTLLKEVLLPSKLLDHLSEFVLEPSVLGCSL